MPAQFVLDKIAKILNKIKVMRRILLILAVVLTQAALVGSARAAPKILSRDGSLVIENPGAKQAKKSRGSEDTLYELLGQEVQVYIFNKKTRVWPQVYGRSVPTPFRGTLSLKDPRLEALIRKYSQIYGVDPSPGAGRDAPRIGLQCHGRVSQGRPGVDAAHAGHRRPHGGEGPL